MQIMPAIFKVKISYFQGGGGDKIPTFKILVIL